MENIQKKAILIGTNKEKILYFNISIPDAIIEYCKDTGIPWEDFDSYKNTFSIKEIEYFDPIRSIEINFTDTTIKNKSNDFPLKEVLIASAGIIALGVLGGMVITSFITELLK